VSGEELVEFVEFVSVVLIRVAEQCHALAMSEIVKLLDDVVS
jgi:hypothetical protein